MTQEADLLVLSLRKATLRLQRHFPSAQVIPPQCRTPVYTACTLQSHSLGFESLLGECITCLYLLLQL